MPDEKEGDLVKCPFCEGLIGASATKCKHCGEWVKASRAGTAAPAPPPAAPAAPAYAPPPAYPPQPQYVYAPQMAGPVQVTVKQPGSVAFAVTAMMFMIFMYPVGLLLSLIGLISGPRRGCFLSLFLVGILLPATSLAILAYTDTRTGNTQTDEVIEQVRELLKMHKPAAPAPPPADSTPGGGSDRGRAGAGSDRSHSTP